MAQYFLLPNLKYFYGSCSTCKYHTLTAVTVLHVFILPALNTFNRSHTKRAIFLNWWRWALAAARFLQEEDLLVVEPLHLHGEDLSHGQALSLPFPPPATISVLLLFRSLCGKFYFNIGDKSAKKPTTLLFFSFSWKWEFDCVTQ